MTREELHALRMAQQGKTPRKLPAPRKPTPPKPVRVLSSRAAAREAATRLGLDDGVIRDVLRGVDLGDRDPIGPKAVQCVALRMIGFSAMEVASTLNLSIEAVRTYLFEARRRGQLADVAPLLDSMALPQAVDNIVKEVNDGNIDVSLAVAKGRGAFRAFEKHDTDAHLGLSIKFEGFEPGQTTDVVEGSIVGAPVQELPPASES